jgi:drug/metabolite transporter (DMT)-like permease
VFKRRIWPLTAHRSLLFAGFLVIFGEFMFASMGVGIRLVAMELPNEVLVFFRNLFGLVLLLPWCARHYRTVAGTQALPLHLLRAAAGVAAMYCFYFAITHIPLAEAMLLKLTAPLFIPIVAFLWLREEITTQVALALGIGFLGVVAILSPDVHGVSAVALIGLLGGALAALAKVTIRRLTHTEPPLRIVFYFSLIATVLSAVPLLWAWHPPTPTQWLGLVAVASLATLGQFALTTGLSLAPASRMAPFGYFSVVFGAGYGWLLWGEPLSWRLALGSLLVAAAGLLVSRRGANVQTRPQPAEL